MNRRVTAFLAVGAMGFGVQMLILQWMLAAWRWPYPVATLVAVEAALLHNFVWHERWTWADRAEPSGGWVLRLVRFHLGSGITSLAGNVLLTAAFVELLDVPPLLANVGAVAATSLANYLVADRWVFSLPAAACAACLLAVGPGAEAAGVNADTLAAWNGHVALVERSLPEHEADPPLREPEGRAIAVPGGTIHEWRGSVTIPGITVGQLVRALTTPGLPPPAPDILDARIVSRHGDAWRVYLKLTRSAVITVVYDTEHDVRFNQHEPGFATSRSVSTRIEETSGADRGFLWRLNSYWRYRQRGTAVVVDVLSLSLSRGVPALVRSVAAPLINRIARESMQRTLDAVERFGRGLPACGTARCAAAASRD